MPKFIQAGDALVNPDNVLYAVQHNIHSVTVVFRAGGDKQNDPVLIFQGDEAREIWTGLGAAKGDWQGEGE